MSARDLGADAILLGPHGVQKDKPLLEYYQQVSDAAPRTMDRLFRIVRHLRDKGYPLNY